MTAMAVQPMQLPPWPLPPTALARPPLIDQTKPPEPGFMIVDTLLRHIGEKRAAELAETRRMLNAAVAGGWGVLFIPGSIPRKGGTWIAVRKSSVVRADSAERLRDQVCWGHPCSSS